MKRRSLIDWLLTVLPLPSSTLYKQRKEADEFMESLDRKCPHCQGKAHDTYKEGLDCCKAQFEMKNRELKSLWKVTTSIDSMVRIKDGGKYSENK